MNSIVFVMVVMSANSYWTPTLEFDTHGKCVDAGDTIKKNIEKTNSVFSRNFEYRCIQIKK